MAGSGLSSYLLVDLGLVARKQFGIGPERREKVEAVRGEIDRFYADFAAQKRALPGRL